MITYQIDWMQTGNELEAMRRAVVRTGVPLAPSGAWIDQFSPFSEEWLQQDQVALQRVAVKQ